MKDLESLIENRISDTGREGCQNVVRWLKEVGFYEVPASVMNHNNYRGGLAKHSWEVYQEALKLNEKAQLPLQSIVLCALLHDVCKFDKYRLAPDGKAKRTRIRENGKHGLYSVEILEELGLKLKEEERHAIWWHMGEHEPSRNVYPEDYENSFSSELCNIIRKADGIASCSWYAEEWLKDFEDAKKQGGTRPIRRQVFLSTVFFASKMSYICSGGHSVRLCLNQEPLRDNVFCENEVSLIRPVKQYDTQVKVVREDCLACAHEMKQADSADDLCVLNLASAINPGGGVIRGAGAQEEYLFRCTDYYRFLFQYASRFDSKKEYRIPRNQRHHYPLGDFGGVFSHGVTVFRDTEETGYRLIDEPWQVNFVAVAAYKLKEGTQVIPANLIESTRKKIRTILRIAYNNHQCRLVLGALGCGAFHNPPRQMALLFREVIEEKEFEGLFREIVFAIKEDHNSNNRNYGAFAEVFSR